MATLSLKDNDFRFTYRASATGCEFAWRHPSEVQPTDVDCTDMDDAEFEAFVAEVAP